MNKELLKTCIRVSSNAAQHAGHDFNDEKHLFFLTLALCGEAGELANMVKKIWRDKTWDESALNMELADIYIYLSLIAHLRGINLDEQAALKMVEVSKRPFAQPVKDSKPGKQTIENRIDNQNKEFDAINYLAEQWRRLQMTPPVDDDYPEIRHYYESALIAFIEALHANRGNTLWRNKQ